MYRIFKGHRPGPGEGAPPQYKYRISRGAWGAHPRGGGGQNFFEFFFVTKNFQTKFFIFVFDGFCIDNMSNFYGLYMRMVWLGPAFDVHSMFGAAECDGFRADPGLTPTPPSRRFRAENAARHAAEISGDFRRKFSEKLFENFRPNFWEKFSQK